MPSVTDLRSYVVDRLLPQVQTPAQYIGGELGAVVKPVEGLRGRLCLAFPDLYSIGMSHHGLQVLYALMNRRTDWSCERVFAPMRDFERLLRETDTPLYGLETFTPLDQFDILGFTLQYEMGCTNLLTILDLGRIPLVAEERTLDHPLVIAGGPSGVNAEPLSRFVDAFVVGDGEETLPAVCDAWLQARESAANRRQALVALAALPHLYVPALYQPVYDATGRQTGVHAREAVAANLIAPAVVADLDACPLPTAPIVPFAECIQDRIAIEIMRGCPGRCRFCQSTTIKRPLRFRKVETIVAAAWESYRNTGLNEISLLSLSTSDYPHFPELIRRLQEVFQPLGVSLSVPSLRINEQLQTVGDLLTTERTSGLTLAPEAALEPMRRRIGKPISDEDLLAGCRRAFENGFQRVKLYFMCGLPGETEADLAGIVDLSEAISRLCREATGRLAAVVANVSNFVPKPQTPFQWNGMQRREYFAEAHRFLRRRLRLRSVQLRCHDVETSLLEGVIARGDRRLGTVIEAVWRAGARFDGWAEHVQPELWWQTLADAGVDVETVTHQPVSPADGLPWDHIGIRQGRGYLQREQEKASL